MRWAGALVVLVACASTAEAPAGDATTPPSSSTESVASPRATPAAPRTSASPASPPPTSPSPGSTSTTSASPAPTTAPGVSPSGFATTAATVTKADGTTCELCVWLADDGDQRSRGLMFVTDLGGADGMAFRYPEPRTGTFWMKNTPLPLSIAFFSPDGTFVDAFDMEPCGSGSCPSYVTPTDFLVAVEVPRGDLDELGLVDGSTLELLDTSCER